MSNPNKVIADAMDGDAAAVEYIKTALKTREYMVKLFRSMRLRDVLAVIAYANGRKLREIGRELKIDHHTVAKAVKRATEI
jgi:DNA-binding MarR family transcriptional regulator